MKKIIISKSHIRIYLRTAAAFLAFYLVMMMVITYIHANSTSKFMNYRVESALIELQTQFLKDAQSYLIKKSDNSNSNESFSQLNEISNLYQQAANIMKNLSYESIYIRAALYDGKDNLIVKTGNILQFERVNDANSKDYGSAKYISLDEYMTQDQINKLFYINKYKILTCKVTGYEGLTNVIPKRIQINSILEDDMVFEPENINNLKLIEYPQGHAQLYAEQISQREDIITPTTKRRYSLCDEIAKPSLDYIRRKSAGGYGGFLQNGIIKGEVGGIYNSGVRNDLTSCYVSYGIVYYPLEVAVSQLVSVYILCLIFVLIITFTLSRKLIKIYEKQQQLENTRKDMTNAVAHELKTPLGIIRSFSEGIKEKIAEDKKDYYLDVIIDETDQMDKMVLQMLDLSKLESNAYKLKLVQFSLKDLLLERLERYKNIFDENKVNIDFVCDDEFNIIADYASFEHIVSNFISNAINHTHEGNNIKISISIINKKVVFSIENQGEHIPKDQLSKIWDSFYKADGSRDRTHGGTGLGLAIAKNYLMLHKAQYGCENTVDGVRFWFNISPAKKS